VAKLRIYQTVRDGSLTITGNAGEAMPGSKDLKRRVYAIELEGDRVRSASLLWRCEACDALQSIPLDEVKLFGGKFLVTVPVESQAPPTIQTMTALRFTAEVAKRVSSGGAETFLLA